MAERPPGYLQIDDGGEGGMPVVFLHGIAGSTEDWAAQLAYLRSTRRAVAVDLRGHGLSGPPSQPEGSTIKSHDYSVASLLTDLDRIVASLKADRFILVGQGMGGSIAAAYASAHSDRVAGLVLVETPASMSPGARDEFFAALKTDAEKTMAGYWQKSMEAAAPTTLAAVQRGVRRVDRDDAVAAVRSLAVFDPVPSLTRYPGPRLLIDGPHADDPEALHLAVPKMPRRVLRSASRWPQRDNPREFNDVLNEFLAYVASTPPLAGVRRENLAPVDPRPVPASGALRGRQVIVVPLAAAPADADFGLLPSDASAKIAARLRESGQIKAGDTVTFSEPRRAGVRDSQRIHHGVVISATIVGATKETSVIRHFMFAEGRLFDVTEAMDAGMAAFYGP